MLCIILYYLSCSPRQADLMIVSGTLTNKMAPAIRRVENSIHIEVYRFMIKCLSLVMLFLWVVVPIREVIMPTVTMW